ncbi:MAG: hypothetical protein RR050_02675 [Bacilli bacterium]
MEEKKVKVVKEETEETFYDTKEKGKILKIIGNVIFYSVLALFAFCAIFGIINFNKVKDNKLPTGYASTKTYEKNNKTITVYNYYAYKIVKEYDNGKTSVSLKLWFLNDAK